MISDGLCTFAHMNDWRKHVYKQVAQRCIWSAIEQIREKLQERYLAVEPQLNKVVDTYERMLEFFATDAPDPDREDILRKLQLQLLGICDEVCQHEFILTDSSPYYETIRLQKGFAEESVRALIDLLEKTQEGEREYEELLKTLFLRVWTSRGLSPDDKEAIIATTGAPRSILISALGLGLRAWWRTADVLYLLRFVTEETSTDEDKMRALIEFVLILSAHPLYAQLEEATLGLRLDAIQEHLDLSGVLERLYKQFFRAQHTERLTHELQEEILPTVQSFWTDHHRPISSRQEIERLFEKAATDPEWMRKIQNSGIEDKMRRISDLQNEGEDVVFGSFRHLKGHSFFNNIHNWFRPFRSQTAPLRQLFEENSAISDMLTVLPHMLCDSDIYSLLLTMMQMPKEGREKVLAHMGFDMGEMYNQIDEIKKQGVSTQSGLRNLAIKRYVENLYRFHKLYYRKEHFQDIFESNLELPRVLVPYLASTSANIHLGNILLAYNRFSSAAPFFERAVQSHPSNELYEQLGYTYQHAGMQDRALEAYTRADILSNGNSSKWLLKQMAACASATGDWNLAVKIYLQLAIQPDGEKRAYLAAASLLVGQKEYRRAIELYLEYRKEGSKDILSSRPLAWCYFCTRNYAKAKKLYEQLCQNPSVVASDELNFGHCLAATSSKKEAIEHYCKAAELYGNDGLENLIRAYQQDSSDLLKAGISIELQRLYIDSVVHKLKNN
ncbi:MAG: hypothetical protein SPI72_03905 [Porphyromonas sp.]|nr:hypothetical protein [Porphyromonas sp.]